MVPQFTAPLFLLLLLPLGGLAYWLWRSAYTHLSRTRRIAALLLRLLILALVALGLAGMSLQIPQNRMAVVYVADLSSSDVRDQTAMQSFINQSSSARPADGLSGVVAAAGNAQVEQPPLPLSGFGDFGTRVRSGSTNLEQGIELGRAIIPDGYRRRVVLLSDGRQTAGDAVLAARILASRGTRVDVVPEEVRGGPDVRVSGVGLPQTLREGERFTVTTHLQSNEDTHARVDVERDGRVLGTRSVTVRRGRTSVSLAQPPLKPGFHSYTVHILPAVDSQPQNNRGSGFSVVGGPPRILVVAAQAAEAGNVVADLRSTGLAVDVRSPSQIVPALDWLQRYSSTVIVDTSADELGSAFMAQLIPYTRDLGHGLLVIGGQRAYGLGGYGHTPLDRILPVHMNIPQRKDLPTVGVALIVESLEAALPVNLSKAAAKGVLQLLSEQDKISVNDAPGDGTPGWVISLRPAKDKTGIARAIDSMTPGDPNSYAPYLNASANALQATDTRLKHIILLGDGDAYDSTYSEVAKAIRSRGITISTVGTNEAGPRDVATLRTIAHDGGGKYYHAEDVTNVPKVFLHEAQTVARPGVVHTRFVPRAVAPVPELAGGKRPPALDGYIATTPKSRAEMMLVSPKLDPVLASWQFGLGRTVAWTSDASGLWTRAWLRDRSTRHFWSKVIRSTLQSVAQHEMAVKASAHGSSGTVSVEVPGSVGSQPRVIATIGAPGGGRLTAVLQPSTPGHYIGSFPLSREGSYFITVVARGAGHAATGRGGLELAYPPEYATTGTDITFLRKIAHAGGGAILSAPDQAWAKDAPAVYDETPLSFALWLLAALLFPIDVALRRLVVTRRDLRRLREAIRPTGRAA